MYEKHWDALCGLVFLVTGLQAFYQAGNYLSMTMVKNKKTDPQMKSLMLNPTWQNPDLTWLVSASPRNEVLNQSIRNQHNCKVFCLIDSCARVLSRGQLFVTRWTVAHQASLSVGFPKQEYWPGLPLSTPGDLPTAEMELVSPELAGRFFTTIPLCYLGSLRDSYLLLKEVTLSQPSLRILLAELPCPAPFCL